MEFWNKGDGIRRTAQGAREIQRKEKISSNHESTKGRKHEGRSDYMKNDVLFRVFQFSCLRDGFWILILSPVFCILFSTDNGQRATGNM
jgi:hypothetical protein